MSAQTWVRRHRVSKESAELVHGWASEKRCSICGAPLLNSENAAHHIALLGSDGVSREWVVLSPERLAAALASSQPLCWDCHVAETFRREHPELVTDRDFRRDN